MNQPLIPERLAQPLDGMLEQTDGALDVDAVLEKMMNPAPAGIARPNDEIARELHRMRNRGGVGLEIIEWLFDLTMRTAPPPPAASMEQAALAAERDWTRRAIGRLIADAIVRGEALEKKGNSDNA